MHDSNTGWLRTATTKAADGLTLHTQGFERNNAGRVIESITKVGQEQSIIRKVYAENPAHLLRFIISPTGQVTEHRNFNQYYQYKEQYTYFTAPYTGAATLEALETWIANVPAAQILKETFDYHENTALKHHELENLEGNNRAWDYEVDILGNIIQEIEPGLEDNRPSSEAKYDNLSRLEFKENAIERVTSINYQAATETTPYTKTTTLPSGVKDTLKLTSSGKVAKQTITADDIKERRLDFTFNGDGQVVNTTDQIKRVTTTLYDDLGRCFGVGCILQVM